MPDGMDLSPSGQFTWTPSAWQSQENDGTPLSDKPYTIHYAVLDGKGGVTTSSFTVDVTSNLPTVTIAATNSLAGEGGPDGQFTVSLNKPAPAGGLDVPLSLSSVYVVGNQTFPTDDEDTDYDVIDSAGHPVFGVIEVPEDQTSVTFSIHPVDDDKPEATEAVFAKVLTNSANTYAVGQPDTGIVYIKDNDLGNGDGTFNVAVSASGIPANQPIDLPEGTTAVVTATVDAHGAHAPTDFKSYWFDLNFNGQYDPGEESDSNTATIDVHYINGPNQIPFYARVIGTDGIAYGNSKPDDIVIDNVPPTITIQGMPETVNVGDTLNLTSEVSDPGPNDDKPWTYAWTITRNGDSYTPEGVATHGVNLSLPITQPGNYSINLSVTDKDQGVGSDTETIGVDCPTIVTAASATMASDGLTAALSVLASDVAGESNLTYTWSVIGDNNDHVSFNDNGDNFAKDCTASFNKLGTYLCNVLIGNSRGGQRTSSVEVDVLPVSTLVISPESVQLDCSTAEAASTPQYTVTGETDQFGSPLNTTETGIIWEVSGDGSIDVSSGLYTAPITGSNASVTASLAGGTSNVSTITLVSPDSTAPVSAIARSTSEVDLTWPITSSAHSYIVYRSTTGTFADDGSDAIAETDGDRGYYIDNSVGANTEYYYLVRMVGSDGASATTVGTCEAETQTSNFGLTSIYGEADPNNNGVHPNEITPSDLIPNNLVARGVNDTTIYLTWTDKTSNETGFEVDMSTSSGWVSVASVPANVTCCMVRQLSHGSHTFAIRAYQDHFFGGVDYTGLSKPASSSTLIPQFDNVIYVIGGHLQHEWELEGGPDGKYARSVGRVFWDLVDSGYNAYLSAESEWGGVINWDGSGLGFSEITNELLVGYTTSDNPITKVGLIGYSHGASIALHLSERLFSYGRSRPADRVVFGATIDAVERKEADWPVLSGDGPEEQSPAASELGWAAKASNWYQPNSYSIPLLTPLLQVVAVHGEAMTDIPIVDNHYVPQQPLYTGDDQSHVSICDDPFVINGIEADLSQTLGYQIHATHMKRGS